MTRTRALPLRRLLAAALASGLLLGGTPIAAQAPAAPLKAKAPKADEKVKFGGNLRKN